MYKQNERNISSFDHYYFTITTLLRISIEICDTLYVLDIHYLNEIHLFCLFIIKFCIS